MSAAAATAWKRRAGRGVLPGFGVTLGITVAMLSLLVLVPFGALVLRAAGLGWHGFWATITAPRSLAALRVSFATALLAALAMAPVGLLLAWTLARYRFPGRRLMDALVDLPLALPTSVAGVALATLYGDEGWFGAPLAAAGVHVAFTPLGIGVALAFVGLPFIVRTLQPVIMALDPAVQEAAMTLGAAPGQLFLRVVLPPLLPALVAGAALAFARAVGEYGSVIFLAGNRPGVSEIMPLLIAVRLQQFQDGEAAALGVAMLAASLLILLLLALLQHRATRWWTRLLAA